MRAAVFDLDGTLIDSMPLWEDIGSRYLRNKRIAPRPGLRDDLKTMSMMQGAAYFREAYGVTDSPERIIGDYCALAEKAYREEVPLKPGAEKLLSFLYQRGVPLCVATANERCLLEVAIKRLDVACYFAYTVTCREIGYGKDEPAFFSRVCARIGVRPEEAVLFDDALHSLQSAKEAGMITCGVWDPSAAPDEEAIRATADYYVTRLDEATALFAGTL